ncbi:MAG TPA: hypothetical protein VI457_04160 [Methylococcaceae bacterium]|nr:hypothetical protein [Methylococcaceae bacterium]
MEDAGKKASHAASGGKNNSALRAAVEEAEILLAFASGRGIALAPEVVKALVKSKTLLSGDLDAPDTFEQQAAFWDAREKLAEAVRPVTIASLKATTQTLSRTGRLGDLLDRWFGEKPFTKADRAVHQFRTWAFWALLGLLVLQVYWIVGSRVTADIKPLLQSVADNQQKQDREQDKLDQQRARSPTAADAADSHEWQRLEAQAQEFERQMLIRYEILQKWNEVWRKPLALLGVLPAQSEQAEPGSPYLLLQKAMLTAEFASHGLERYILPLLYGFLGACLYVLRTLASDIKALAYTPEQNTLYRLRVYMGMLAGLIIIWFLPVTEADPGLKSLTPFALAFLAGYSIDLLFALMDKLIAAFSGK